MGGSKKFIFVLIAVVLLSGGIYAGKFYYDNLRGIGPAISKPPAESPPITVKPSPTPSSTKPVIEHDQRFTVPQGFSFAVFAKFLPGARVMKFDKDGNLWVSQTSQGKVSRLTITNGVVTDQKTMLSGLQKPHGLAFDPEDPSILFVAEETKISSYSLKGEKIELLKKIIDLPKGANHFTRTLLFGPDNRLYVTIGSTCNVCLEKDERHASMWSLNKDGSDWREVAKGLRNSVFMITNETDGKIWATDMGRDLIGDDVPPDEINIIPTDSKQVLNYGWPICYGKNIHDTDFDKNTYFRNPCMEPFEIPSHIDLQAHSAPLGLAFVPNEASWPEEYLNDLLVAFHGSWNRTIPTGYKVVRIELDDARQPIKQTDFITGFIDGKTALGRPVDIIFDRAGTMYLSDDRAGVIYIMKYDNIE